MRNIRWFTTTAAATVAAAAIATTATAAPSRASAIKLDAKVTSFHKTDVAPTGDSAGDAFQVTDRLTQHGRLRGIDSVSCVHTDRIFYECDWTVVLDKGSIQLQGRAHDTNSAYTLPVTGGTGSYVDARGTMTVTDALQAVAHYTIRLS